MLTAILLALSLTPGPIEDPAGGTNGTAAEETLALIGAHLIPISGPEIEEGILIARDGRWVHVGELGSVAIPNGARTIDMRGKVILPGLVCTHSHVGQVSGADSSAPIQPDVRALDGIDVRDSSVQRAQAGGITTANIMPGSGHLLSGQTVYLKLRDGETIEDLLLYGEDGSIAGGIKMANGTNPQGSPPFPGTRAKAAALMRAKLLAAQEYAEKVAEAGDDPEKKPSRDLGLEALGEALSGKRVVHHHTHRHDDILTVLRLAKEFGFRVVLHHISDGWMVADEIAAAGAPCSVIMIDSPGGKLEAKDLRMETGAVLDRAGASVSFHTDDYITDSRLFLRSPALAMRAGMDRQSALAAVTLEGARQLDLDDRIGSLEVGKDADFVVLDGDPLSVYTKILETWIEGERVFDRSDPQDRLWAVGGYGAGRSSDGTICCGGDAR